MSRLFAILLLVSGSASAQASIAAQWKARAVNAARQLKTLNSKLEANPESTESKHLLVQASIEMAFASHLNPKLKDKVHEVSAEGEAFHVVFNGGKDGLLDVAFLYKKAAEPPIVRVDWLPKHWQLLILGTSLCVTRPDFPTMCVRENDPLGEWLVGA